MSDLCSSVYCADIALPGRDLCAACQLDADSERHAVAEEARRLTDEHEARLEEAAA